MFTPVHQTLSLAIDRVEPVAPIIPPLLGWCCPPTVARSIVAIVIYSINGMLGGRPLAHVFDKVHQSILPGPSPAYANAACAIVFVPWRARLVTPAKHGLQDEVPPIPTEAVTKIRRSLFASTTLAGAIDQTVLINLAHDSAHATTIPATLPARPGGRLRDHCPVDKRLSSKINPGAHGRFLRLATIP